MLIPSMFETKTRRSVGRWVGAAVGLLGLAALAIPAGRAAAAGPSAAPIQARVHPLVKLGMADPGHNVVPLPNLGECLAKVGLACYTPRQIRTGYDLPDNLTGAGQTIVIIDAYGSPTIRQDLATFDHQFALPNPTLNIYEPTGRVIFHSHNAQMRGWAFETSLDVEWAHAMAPQATIDLVAAANPQFNTLTLAEAWALRNLPGQVMSMSFGAPENEILAGGLQGIQVFQRDHAVFQQAAMQGWTVLASAGDTGANNLTGVAAPNYPSSDPLVTSVGGTDLFLNQGGHYLGETVWNDSVPALCPFGCAYGPFGATGGAPSLDWPTPGYQRGVQNYGMRTTADVAWNASVYTAVWVYLSVPGATPGFYFVGGTSEGAPSWAGVVADADQMAGHPLGQLNPLLYQIAQNPTLYARDFHNVTVGQNAFMFGPGFSAHTGYNIPTGLGSPNVKYLIQSLAGRV